MTAAKTTPRLLPPHYLVLALAAIVTSIWLPGPSLWGSEGRWGWLTLALLAMASGIAIAVAGSRQFGRAGTNIIPFTQASTLVTEGVFQWSRNPMYLGMLLTLAGAALASNRRWSLVVPILFYGIIRFGFIRHEESQMQQTFGAEFSQYCARTRRWL